MPERSDGSFEDALDHARQRERDGTDASCSGRPPSLRAALDFGPALASGGEARFELALDWAGEPEELLRRQAPPGTRREPGASRADSPEEIARELGLGEMLTLRQIESRWRSFLWRNHPDRQPADAREHANARVAIANALYQAARRDPAARG